MGKLRFLFVVLLLVCASAKPQYEFGNAAPPSPSPPTSPPVLEDQVVPETTTAAPKKEKPTTAATTPKPKPKTTAAPVTKAAAPTEAPTTKRPVPKGPACPTDTLFVIDSTSSVKNLFEKHREYAANVVKELIIDTDGDHVGVILFASKYRRKVKISLADPQDSANVTKTINALPYISGITAIGASLELAIEELKNRRTNVPTNLVVITDGFSYDFVDDASKVLHSLPNLRIFTVTVGEAFRESDIQLIAGEKGNIFKGPDSYKELLPHIKQCGGGSSGASNKKTAGNGQSTSTSTQGRGTQTNELGEDRKKDDIVTPSSGNSLQSVFGTDNGLSDKKTVKVSSENSGDQKSVELPKKKTTNSNGSKSKSKSSESASKEVDTKLTSGTKGCKYDVLFVIDASGSLRGRFTHQLELAAELAQLFPEDNDATHFAFIRYSGKRRTHLAIPFSSNASRTDFASTCTKVQFMGGTTFTDKALSLAYDEITGPDARPSAQPIVIVFTDGFSRNDPTPIAEKIHAAAIPVITVGITDGGYVNLNELREIASGPNLVFLDNNIQELKNLINSFSGKC
uniref:VWFA domain-containing protein n=1 Tax=Panagrellus redivivus TaxID=6233 RepID=A0A7E4ZTT2_PANRE